MKNRPLTRRELVLLVVLSLVFVLFYWKDYLDHRGHTPPPPGPTLPEDIQVLPGFKVRLLYTAETNEGSWISMAFDPKGRLIVSPEKDGNLLRLTLSGRKVSKVERIPQPVTSAMGLLYAKDSLFLDGQGPNGWGIYRMRDKGDDFAPPELLCLLHFTEAWHGAHAIVLGPDEKLYVVCGDHTELPTDISPASPLTNYADDQLLPSDRDPTGWDANGPPEGFVFRMGLDGKNRELFGGGSRNNYCIAFNADGELFGFDNDHDYDYGLPWYRPTRVNHWISGADFGHRPGTGKLPEYDEDTLPPALEVGIGGPSGVAFAPANCAFPPPYKDALFMADWQYGRLLAVQLFPRGATYAATIETALRGRALNIVAMAFGPDGNLCFITGGNGTPSALYSVTWTGSRAPFWPKTAGQLAAEKNGALARSLRHRVESFQGRQDPTALDAVWPALCSEDRWLRYAARVALEFQDVSTWQKRALTETNTLGGLTALLALARCDKTGQAELFAALGKFPWSALTEEQQLLKLRVMELSFIWQGRPSTALAESVIQELDPLYPSADDNLNHELCQLLLYLDAPRAVAKTLALRDKTGTLEEQIYYVMRLRNITNGWTMAERKDYLSWFLVNHESGPHRPEMKRSFTSLGEMYYNGSSFNPYLSSFRKQIAASMTPAERLTLADYLRSPAPSPSFASTHKFVKSWQVKDLLPDLAKVNKGQGRHLVRGLRLLRDAQCLVCHRFGDDGGSYGPNLTAVGSRLSAQGILESIIEPSRVIEQNYQNTVLILTNGDDLVGRVVGEDDKNLLVITNYLDLTSAYVPKTNIVSRRLSKVSPMPEGLVNSLTEDEIWDLVGCLHSGYHTHGN